MKWGNLYNGTSLLDRTLQHIFETLIHDMLLHDMLQCEWLIIQDVDRFCNVYPSLVPAITRSGAVMDRLQNKYCSH